jgi:hypothetical protein
MFCSFFLFFVILNLPSVFRHSAKSPCGQKILGKELFTNKMFVECYLPSIRTFCKECEYGSKYISCKRVKYKLRWIEK